MAVVFAFILKNGEKLDCTEEELEKRGIPLDQVEGKEALYDELEEKLSSIDINNLLDSH